MRGLSLSRTPSWDIKRQTRQTNKQIKAEQELLFWGEEGERKGKQRHISQVASYVKPSAAGMSSARGESRWGLLCVCVCVRVCRCVRVCVCVTPKPTSISQSNLPARQRTQKHVSKAIKHMENIFFFARWVFSFHFWLSCKHFRKSLGFWFSIWMLKIIDNFKGNIWACELSRNCHLLKLMLKACALGTFIIYKSQELSADVAAAAVADVALCGSYSSCCCCCCKDNNKGHLAMQLGAKQRDPKLKP